MTREKPKPFQKVGTYLKTLKMKKKALKDFDSEIYKIDEAKHLQIKGGRPPAEPDKPDELTRELSPGGTSGGTPAGSDDYPFIFD